MTAVADGHVVTEPMDLHVTIVHASPGRLRFKLPREELLGREFDRAERALRGKAGIRDIQRNPLASSALVLYNPDLADLASLMEALEAAGVNVVLENLEDALAGEGAAGSATLGDAIGSFFTNADQRVARMTGGRADLKTLVPVGLGALAVREVLSGRAIAAPWYVLAWYAFDSFTKLRQAPKSNDSTSG